MVAESASRSLIIDPSERRAAERWAVARCEVKMIWREGHSRFPRAAGRLVDISERGAGIVAGRNLSNKSLIWIGLNRLPWEWVKAHVRAVRPRGDLWFYHLEFAEPCPPGLLEVTAQPHIDELILMWNP